MITIINEKKSQAQDYAKALGGPSGTMPQECMFPGEEYQIVYAAGHLYEWAPLSDMVDDPDTYSSWNLDDLPFDRHGIHWHKALIKDKERYIKPIKDALAKSDKVIISTDNDPSGEGDTIGWEIIDGLHFQGDVYRDHHRNQTPEGVIEAMKTLKHVDHNDGMLKKAIARQKFDFLTIQYVRMATDVSRRAKRLAPGAIIREGRLKTAVVTFVADREKKNKEFKPHSDYQMQYKDEDGNWFKNPDAECFKTPEEAAKAVLPASKSHEASVKNVSKKPPKLLDLSTVSAILEKKGYATTKIMDYAEKLYQDGFLSYPRTEDKVITKEDLDALVPLVPDICAVVGVDESDIHEFRSYLIGDGAHGANRPGLTVPESLDYLDERYGDGAGALYKELALSFLAGFGANEELKRHIFTDESGNYKASYTEVIDPGFTKIMKPDEDDDEDEAKTLRPCALTPEVYEKKAVRPALATWSSLAAFLAKYNIGTGATRLTTYNEIKSGSEGRKLIESKKGKLTVTTLGAQSAVLMNGTKLADWGVTQHIGIWLNDIESGKVKENQILNYFDKIVAEDKKTMMGHASELSVFKQQTAHGKVNGVFHGEEVTISDGWGDHDFTPEELEKLFNGDVITIESKGKKFTGKLQDREKYGLGFDLISNDYTGIYQPTGEEVTFSLHAVGRDFTEDEAKTLLTGESVKFEAYSAKKKKQYEAEVILKKAPGFKDPTVKWRIVFKPFEKSGKSTGKKKSYKKKK